MSVAHTEVTGGSPPADLSCAEDCGVRDVQDRLGDKWTVHVVVELAGGVRRYRELQRLVPGISQRMLTVTLRRLERDGLVTRTVHPTVPPQVEYELTPTGRDLTGLVKALVDWSLEHRAAIAEARSAYDARRQP
ncbi:MULTISPECIES: helix-turn-helix domain-containing protein [unclassified Streptomyces]|uniref:winged helix-turn-helix transcriptional regulator n=1 Tax=unclassified Streptomyces TaxID=2593676 RepID=UPI00331BA9D9